MKEKFKYRFSPSGTAGLFVMAGGFSVIIGWLFDIQLLKTVMPGLTSMRITTAFSFIFTGASLFFLSEKKSINLSNFLSFIVLFIGLSSAADYIFVWFVRPEGIFLIDNIAVRAAFTDSAKMSFITSGLFLLSSLCLIFISRKKAKNIVLIFSFIISFVSFFSIMEYLFGTSIIGYLFNSIPMALHTCIYFLILSLGFLLFKNESESVNILNSEKAGGYMIRRLLPAVIFIPVIVGWLDLNAHSIGLIDFNVAVIFFVTFSSSILLFLIWRNAVEFDRIDLIKQKAEKKYLKLIDGSPIGLYAADPEGNFLEVNKKLLEIFGYDCKEKFYESGLRTLHTNPEDYEQWFTLISKNNSVNNFVFKAKRNDGTEIWINHNSNAAVDESGRILIIEGSIEDITEQKIAKEIIKNSEKRFRSLIENGNDIILLMDAEGKIKYISQPVHKNFGYKPEELIGLSIINLLHPDETKVNKQILEKVLANPGVTINAQIRKLHREGYYNWIELTATNLLSDPDINSIVVNYRDITQKKIAEDKLRDSKKKYKDIFDYATIGIFQSKEDGTIIKANKCLVNMLGYDTIEEFLKLNLKDDIYFDKNDRAKIIELMDIRTTVSDYEVQWKKKNNELIWVNIRGHKVNHNGKSYYEGFINDITKSKSAEKALRDSEKKFKELADLLPLTVFETDLKGNLKFYNAAALKTFGYKTDESNDLNVFNFIVPEDVLTAKQNFRKIIVGEKTFGSELRAMRKNGEVFPCIIYANQIYNDKRTPIGIRAVLIDITDRKKALEDLMNAKEKAEEANRLKSGFLSAMSHEIRTPLNAILGITAILKDEFCNNVSTDIKDLVYSMEEAGERLLSTITQILDIARLEAHDFEINLEAVSVNKTIKNIHKMIRPVADQKGLNILFDIPEKEVIVKADKYCLDGVFLNLISNSIKYSNHGDINISVKENGKNVYCEITDSGIGISEEYQKHLFEIFSQEDFGLTRKFEGTGLGLAITKKYLQVMNGDIKIESLKNVKTTATFWIPKFYN
jgi:PAS domain S-box-containing protein